MKISETLKKSSPHFILASLLSITALVVWWPISHATQFVYDDTHFIMLNESFYKITQFKEIFSGGS
jgi:hypothetical protein